MAFRADETARIGYDRAVNYLISRIRDVDESQRALSKEALEDIVYKYGPVIDSYPSWHPLVSNHDNRDPVTDPSRECGYKGLDHTIYLANAFITCPYHDGQDVIDSVDRLPPNPVATITAERLDVQLYQSNANPILVKCDWNEPLSMDGMIPLSLAMPLLLEKEIPCWQWSQVAETWETMRPYFLGTPHGSRSSLFVNQDTGQAIKKVWNALIYTGMFGPIKVR
jgi:hypothetical protein